LYCKFTFERWIKNLNRRKIASKSRFRTVFLKKVAQCVADERSVARMLD
jgi:hypothetical protein